MEGEETRAIQSGFCFPSPTALHRHHICWLMQVAKICVRHRCRLQKDTCTMEPENSTKILVIEDRVDDSFLLTRQLAREHLDDCFYRSKGCRSMHAPWGHSLFAQAS